MSKRAYKFRFYPTDEQAQLLARTFGCTRVVYNHILNWRKDAFEQNQEKIGYAGASRKLTAIKMLPEFSWLNEVSCVPLPQCLRHQQAAFKNFFDKRSSYPKFKSKHHRQSIALTKSGFKYLDGELYMAKSKEPLAVR
ncbi:MAG: putative transposase [Motiliproteus sp.]|jgi:putative transposase